MARPREFDEREVLRAAVGVFRLHGYAGASVQALTAATGLGKGSLYGAFGSKHDLYLAALDEYRRTNVGAALRVLESSGRPIDDLRAYLLDVAARSADGTPNCMLTGAAVQLADPDAPVAERVSAAFDEIAAAMRLLVQDAQADGDIAADADPAATADLLLVLARGADVLGQAGTSGERLAAVVDAAFAALAPRQSPQLSP